MFTKMREDKFACKDNSKQHTHTYKYIKDLLENGAWPRSFEESVKCTTLFSLKPQPSPQCEPHCTRSVHQIKVMRIFAKKYLQWLNSCVGSEHSEPVRPFCSTPRLPRSRSFPNHEIHAVCTALRLPQYRAALQNIAPRLQV